MAAKTGSRNGVSYGWALGENNWNTLMDGNLTLIDRFGIHLSFKSFFNTPPGSPAAGDCYVVGSAPTGAWVGRSGQVAVFDDGAWRYGVPRLGWRGYCEADKQGYVFDTVWVAQSAQVKDTPLTNSNVTATASAASLIGGLRTGTPTGEINLQLPTGADVDSAFSGLTVGQSFEWSVVNLAPATHAITVTANTGHAVVGNPVIAANTSGRFASRKAATDSFVSYRLA